MGHYDCKSCHAAAHEEHAVDCERYGAVASLRQGSGQTFDSPVADRQEVKEMYTKKLESCPSCGALPCDWVENPWTDLPWIVTMRESGNRRFLIDRRDQTNRDMFSGYLISGAGTIGDGISLGTGSGGRLNFHRSHFFEELPE